MAEFARLKIRLKVTGVRVWRQIEVRLDTRLDDLHLVFQAAMGWEDCHLYEFSVGRSIRFGIRDPNWDDPRLRSVESATLADLIRCLRRDRTFEYLYDFGDGWRHAVKVEHTAQPEPNAAYPRLLKAKGQCPPEDCGGPGGYIYYLEAISDPHHEGHEEMVAWGGPDFEPDVVDEEAIRQAFAALGARKPQRRVRQ